VTLEPDAPTTRERALEAGLQVWLDTDPATLFGGMNVSRVAKRAGITRATFYSYWGTAQEYLDDLVSYSTRGALTVDDDFATNMVRLTLARDDIASQIVASAVASVRALRADPAFRLRLAMLSKGDDPVVAAKLREQYAEAEASVAEMFTALLARWGRIVRPPLEMPHMVALLASQLEGYAARAIFDPGMATPERYAHGILAHLLTLTTPIDVPRDTDELVRVIDRWPDDGDRIRTLADRAGSGTTEPRADINFDPREVVRLTRMIIAERPWAEITLGNVARRAGFSAVTITSNFGSKHGLGTAVLEMMSRENLEALPPVDDPLERLRLQLRTVADLLHRAPALSHSAMMNYTGMAQGPAPDVVTWHVVPLIAQTVAEAQCAGQLSTEVDPEQVAIMITCAQVCRATAHNTTESYGPGDPAEFILRGLGATPDPRGLRADGTGTRAALDR
jgi:AcrR family transcriptional regulator